MLCSGICSKTTKHQGAMAARLAVVMTPFLLYQRQHLHPIGIVEQAGRAVHPFMVPHMPHPPPRPLTPPGARCRLQLCPYCNRWKGEIHRFHCERAPFPIWAEYVRSTAQQGGREALPAITAFFCELCLVGWHSQKAYSMHKQNVTKKDKQEPCPFNELSYQA